MELTQVNTTKKNQRIPSFVLSTHHNPLSWSIAASDVVAFSPYLRRHPVYDWRKEVFIDSVFCTSLIICL